MRHIIIIILIFIGLSSSAQYIDNKLNFEVGIGFTQPISSEYVQNNDFKYPSLFGSYNPTFSPTVAFQYKLNNIIWIGAEYSTSAFNTWTGNSKSFILENPKSELTTARLTLNYFPTVIQFASSNKLGFIFASGIYSHNLIWGELYNSNQSFSIDTYNSSYNDKNFEFGLGFVFVKNFSLNFAYSIKATYNLGLVNNPYLNEQTMHSLNLSFALVFRTLKNTHFQYE